MDDPSAAHALTRMHWIRHGAVEDAWRGRIYGDLDVALSESGRAEAAASAERLADRPLAAVVSSGLARAEFGAALLRAPRGLERRDEPALRELARGAWRGLAPAQIEAGAFQRWLDAPRRARPPGGESLADLTRRALPCVQALAREHAGEEIAIVSHCWVIRSVLCAALQLSLDRAASLAVPTGSWSVIDWPAAPGELLPTLVGLALDAVPDRSRRWLRGPHRG